MSYTIEPMPLITFIEDSKMKLPRFQRKATWDKKQNFELCISVFQYYPVGVVIVNKDQNVSWLLDGRQRRNALKKMRENPVEVYDWAKAYIGFQAKEDIGEITRLYWNKVETYLRTANEIEEDNEGEDESSVDQYDEEPEDVLESSFDSEKQKEGLQTLLDLILMVHQVSRGVSRWEKTFDFKEYCQNLKYELKRENYKIKPEVLRRFLLDLSKSNPEGITIDSFISYYEDNANLISGKETKFKTEIEENWKSISEDLRIITRTEKIFDEARIGIIWLANVSQLDAQNIFSRINKGGTQLKSEELLSAKPFWNQSVNVSNEETKSLVKELYNKLGVEEPNGIVKWDLAATLVDRIDKNHLIFDKATKSNEVDLDRVTIGFKILSSVFAEGMSAKDVESLEKNNSINWESSIDDLVADINTICEILSNDAFFKCLKSWKRPLIKLLGSAITLEFVAILKKAWEDADRPTVSGAAYKGFQRKARILFDRLVFEYSTKVWRGSGDSKMSSDIREWRARLTNVNKEDWIKFIESALSGTYNGQVINQKTITPVLYYYFALNNESPDNAAKGIDVDHIIPQEKFADNNMVDQSMKNSLSNLSLLPKTDNIAKKNKALNEIVDPWLKNQIVKYEKIPLERFEFFSDITHIVDLKTLRGDLFKSTFDRTRDTVLSN